MTEKPQGDRRVENQGFVALTAVSLREMAISLFIAGTLVATSSGKVPGSGNLTLTASEACKLAFSDSAFRVSCSTSRVSTSLANF